MENFKKNFTTYITLEKEDMNLINQVIIDVKNITEPFNEIMDFLNTYISHESIKFRKSALRIISLLVERLPNLDLSSQISRLFDISYMRLTEPHLSASAIRIIYSNYTNFNIDLIDRYRLKIIVEDEYNKILDCFKIDNFNIPNYNQETRSYAIRTLSIFLNHYSDKTFFLDRVNNYLQIVLDAIDGEKDPRNILLIFHFIFRINSNLDSLTLQPFNERFFNILDEYYPIEFSPPKNSPEPITSEQLSTKLNDCIASNEAYMEYLIESVKGNNRHNV
jgi:DNA repair/transcription protein MET18/MMS19